MSLDTLIATVLGQRIAVDAITGDWKTQAKTVKKARDYYDGDHDFGYLTDDQRKALRLKEGEGVAENYMPLVVDTFANRLQLTGVTADNDAATKWVNDTMEANRIDILQDDVHKSSPRDGETYAMIGIDNDTGRARITHEPAYDGATGMRVVYESDASRKIVAAVKVWSEVLTEAADIAAARRARNLMDAEALEKTPRVMTRLRVNAYFPDRLEKYASLDMGMTLQPYIDKAAGETDHVQPWVDGSGQPLGVPIVAFRNRARGSRSISRLANAIPLQDAINRLALSLIIASERTAFSNRFAIGFDPDPNEEGLSPGDWIIAAAGGAMQGEVYDVKMLESGDISQILAAKRDLIRSLGNVTGTPAPEIFDSDNLSGEAFKAREVTQVFECRSFITHASATWEEIFDYAWLLETEFSAEKPPMYERFRAQYADVVVSNTKDDVANAVSIANTGRIPNSAFYRMLAPAYKWDDKDVEQYLADLETEKQNAAQTALDAVSGFGADDAELAPGAQSQQRPGPAPGQRPGQNPSEAERAA